MSTATLNGIAATSCRVTLPAAGVWWAEVELDQPEALDGAVTLVVADLTLSGTIVSGGVWQGRARYRIAAGAAGWGRTVRAAAYTNDIGIKLSKVVADLARDAGETIGTVAGDSVGVQYVRGEGVASVALTDLTSGAWYVDEAGVTQIGRRTASTYTGTATRLPRDPSGERIELAPSTLSDLLPGAVVDELEAIDVEHTLEAGKLRTTIWGAGPVASEASRLPDALRKIVSLATARHRYHAPWQYRVVARTGERLTLQAVRSAAGMPDLSNVRIRPGVAGLRAHPALGSRVLVSFLDGDPSQPVVTGFEEQDGAGWVPGEVSIMAGATGVYPTEHATSAEAAVLLVQQTLAALGAALTAAGSPTGATVTTLSNDAGVAAIVAATAAGTLGVTVQSAIDLALAGKSADANGRVPSLGWPNVRGG